MSSSLRADQLRGHRTDPGLVSTCRLDPRTSGQVHRTLMDAFGHPGRIVALSDGASRVPRALLVGLALADVGVRVAVLEDDSSWGPAVAAATGATLVEADRAELVVALRPLTLEELRVLPRGSALAPEMGATLVARVEDLGVGPVRLELSGPGVDGTRELAVQTSQGPLLEHLLRSRHGYPAGVDTILEAGSRIVGLPRSTSITRTA